MADKKYQSHIYGLTRALLEGALVEREIGISLDTSKYELIAKLPSSGYIYFPASVELAKYTTPTTSGANYIGVNGTNFNSITGDTNLQNVLQSINDVLDILTGSTSAATLEDISANSLTSASQTFTIKTGTSFLIKDHLSANIVEISYSGLNIHTSGAAEYRAEGVTRIVSDGTFIGFDLGISPDSMLHVHKASAGTMAPVGNTVVTVENSTDAYISILTPAGTNRGIIFGNSSVSSLIYEASASTLHLLAPVVSIEGDTTDIVAYTGNLSLTSQTALAYLGGYTGLTLEGISGPIIINITNTSYVLDIQGKTEITAPTNRAPLRLVPITSNTELDNGDVWITSANLFARINGATKTIVQKLSDISAESLSTADQTFTCKASTSIIYQDNASNNLLNMSSSSFLVSNSTIPLYLYGTSINITTTQGVIFSPSDTSGASLRVPHGTAPSSPSNGDMWTTTAGLFVRIDGVTKQVA